LVALVGLPWPQKITAFFESDRSKIWEYERDLGFRLSTKAPAQSFSQKSPFHKT